MPLHAERADIVRVVVGRRGRVAMRMQLVIRFDYGAVVPWVRRLDGGLGAVAGPDALELRTGVPMRGEGLTTVAEFDVAEGERVPFALTWHASHRDVPAPFDADEAIRETEA